MRRVQSAPSLAGMAHQPKVAPPSVPVVTLRRSAMSYDNLGAAARSAGPASSSRRGDSSGIKPTAQHQQPPSRSGCMSARSRVQRGPSRGAALFADLPAFVYPPASSVAEEAEEFMIETASRGVVGAECFEMFGGDEAPRLVDGLQLAGEADRMMHEMQLASCLATPVVEDDFNLGEHMHAAVRRLAVQSEEETQLRYVQEIKARAIGRDDGAGAAPQLRATSAARRRRRPSEDMDEAFLAELISETPAAGRSEALDTPPALRSMLASVYQYEDHAKNTLSLDEDDVMTSITDARLRCAALTPLDSIDEDVDFSMGGLTMADAPETAALPPLVSIEGGVSGPMAYASWEPVALTPLDTLDEEEFDLVLSKGASEECVAGEPEAPVHSLSEPAPAAPAPCGNILPMRLKVRSLGRGVEGAGQKKVFKQGAHV